MKNKKNIFIVLFLLILGIISIFFISNNKNLYTCHNISWNDTPSDVDSLTRKLDENSLFTSILLITLKYYK